MLFLSRLPSPRFLVSVASKAFSDPVSGLESTPAGYLVGVDSKADTNGARAGKLEGGRTICMLVAKLGASGSRATS